MKALNHCTQFLDAAASDTATKGQLSLDPEPAARLLGLLREAQKFVVPDKGHLLFGPRGIPHGNEVHRLPYPVVAVEATWTYDKADRWQDKLTPDQAAALGSSDSSRRIALAFEVGADAEFHSWTFRADRPTSALASAPPPGGRIDDPIGYVVCCLFRNDATGSWHPVPGAFLIRYDNTVPEDGVVVDHLGNGDEYHRSRVSIGMPALPDARTMAVVKTFVAILPGLYMETYGRDRARECERLSTDVVEEVRMMLELCIALSCSNVSSERKEPSRVMQSERRRRRKAPLFDHHVLVVDGRRVEDRATTPVKGTHASPRTHLRRGHLRRLPGREERIWINDALVNPGNGFSDKSYDVRPPR